MWIVGELFGLVVGRHRRGPVDAPCRAGGPAHRPPARRGRRGGIGLDAPTCRAGMKHLRQAGPRGRGGGGPGRLRRLVHARGGDRAGRDDRQPVAHLPVGGGRGRPPRLRADRDRDHPLPAAAPRRRQRPQPAAEPAHPRDALDSRPPRHRRDPVRHQPPGRGRHHVRLTRSRPRRGGAGLPVAVAVPLPGRAASRSPACRAARRPWCCRSTAPFG